MIFFLLSLFHDSPYSLHTRPRQVYEIGFENIVLVHLLRLWIFLTNHREQYVVLFWSMQHQIFPSHRQEGHGMSNSLIIFMFMLYER